MWVDAAQRANGSHWSERGKAVADSLIRNRMILERLACLDAAGIEKLRTGKAPTITKGPYAGEIATGDHIIPRSVAPELDNCLFNLEFMPATLNNRKGDKVTDRRAVGAEVECGGVAVGRGAEGGGVGEADYSLNSTPSLKRAVSATVPSSWRASN